MKQIMPNTAVSESFGLSAQLCGYHIAVKKKIYKKFTTTFAMAALLMVFGWVTLTANVHAQPLNFRAHLTGKEEVPPVDTKAQGQAIFQVAANGTSMHFQLNIANIENVTQAHIHLGPAGTNGPVVVWLYPSMPPAQLIEGRFQGVLAANAITAANLVGPLAEQTLEDLIEHMLDGNTYVNVHTLQHPPGEIRGQIR